MHVNLSLVSLVAAAVLVGACSSNGVSSMPDSDAGITEDSTAPDEDSSTQVDAAVATKVGSVCTKMCSPGQACVGVSDTGQSACIEKCDSKGVCANGNRCKSGYCFPSCVNGRCPGALSCFSPDIPNCIFDCYKNPALCGPTEMCDGNFACVPKPVEVVCAPGGGAASSGLAGTVTVGALTLAERGTFCDWAAAVTGGYGCVGKCDGGSVSFAASQSECRVQFTKAGCKATVAEVEACIKDNAKDVCSLAILSAPSCASLRGCL